jgi:uncharacterized protein YjbI with pentapeptide repeats
MRNEDTLISDLFRLSSFQWNEELSKEFNLEFGSLIVALNDYNYSQPSEKTIHESLLKSPVNSTTGLDFESDEEKPPISDPSQIGRIISTVRRGISNVSIEYGKTFRSYMFFGIDFTSCDLPGIVMDGCIFSNCSFIDCIFPSGYFASGKFVECQFNGCDLGDANFNKVGLFGVTFIDCNLEGANFFDCVQHIVLYYNCEMDGVTFISGSLHKVEVESSSLKKITLAGMIISASQFMNSSLKGGQIINNRFVGCGFSRLHVDSAIQAANAYLGCNIPSELEDFFMEDLEEGSNEDGEDGEDGDSSDELRDKNFDEIMGGDDDDD